jgi:hypothetical protein
MMSRCGAFVGDMVVVAGLVASTSCARTPVGKASGSMEPLVMDNELNLWSMARTSSVIMARTVRVGPSGGGWSGTFEITQALTVEVEDTLCGPPRSGAVQVIIPLVQGSRLADRVPAIVPWLAAAGSRAIFFLHDDRPADDDLGAIPATADVEARIRTLCGGPMPAGTPTMLEVLVQLAAEDTTVAAPFAAPLAGVIDVIDRRDVAVARLTVIAGVLRTFSGVRLTRAATHRPADVTLRATAAELAAALAGGEPVAALVARGQAPALLDALSRGAAVVGASAPLRARVRTAGGI